MTREGRGGIQRWGIEREVNTQTHTARERER